MILFFIQDRKDKVKRKEQEARLEDELIYDPETGSNLTLEEAEKGRSIRLDVPLRIKSNEEIAANYADDDKELEYIKRHFAEAIILESSNEELIHIINGSKFIRQFTTFELLHLWSLTPNTYVGLIQISNDYLSGRDMETVFETQLLVALKRFSVPDMGLFVEYEIAPEGEWEILRLPGKAKFTHFMDLLNKLRGTAR